MRTTLITLVAAALVAVSAGSPAAATTPTDLTRAGVHLMGDSIAYHVAKGHSLPAPARPAGRPTRSPVAG